MMTGSSTAWALTPSGAAATVGPRSGSPIRRALPPPRRSGGLPLMEALARPCAGLDFARRPIAAQLLSDLLWAAYGVNRSSGDRTAPYWHHAMVIDLYAIKANGAWRHDAPAHALERTSARDLRATAAAPEAAAPAPLVLACVAHRERMTGLPPAERELYATVDAAFVARNVELFCASEGLATVVRGWINPRLLADVLRLNEDETPLLAQTVGRPAAG